MLLSQSAALWFLPFVIPIAIWVAWSDLARMKIPNKAVLALLGVYLVIGLIVFPFDLWLSQLINFAVVLGIGFLLTLTGMVGAGDAIRFLFAQSSKRLRRVDRFMRQSFRTRQ